MRSVSIALACLLSTSVLAAEAPVKQDPAAATAAALHPSKLTINDCLAILSGLNGLDGHQVVVNAGKPNEQVVMLAYEFKNGRLRGDIATDIAMLTAVQRTAQEAQQRIFKEVAGDETEIKPGSAKSIEYDRELRELTSKDCPAAPVHITDTALKLDTNEIPSSVLAALDKIRDR